MIRRSRKRNAINAYYYTSGILFSKHAPESRGNRYLPGLNSVWDLYIPQLKGKWKWEFDKEERRYVYLFDSDKALSPELTSLLQLLLWIAIGPIPPTPPISPTS